MPYDLLEDLAYRIIERQKENIWLMAVAFNDPKQLHKSLFGEHKKEDDGLIDKLKGMGFEVKDG